MLTSPRSGSGRTSGTSGSRRRRLAGLGLVAIAGLVAASCGTQTAPTGAGGTSSTAAATAVVSGSVVVGPSCPVARVSLPCAPKPLRGVVVEAVRGGAGVPATSGRVAAEDRSGHDGSYALTLPAGTYDLEVASTGAFPRCAPVAVTVTAGANRHMNLTCDSGIR